MNEPQDEDNSPPVVSMRTMEIVTAVVLLVLSAVVIQDSVRVGAGWADSEGPRAGYFPFYIGIFLGLASLATLIKAIMVGRADKGEAAKDAKPFVTAQA